MAIWTILLQRPDYASDPTLALTLARDEVLAADGTEDGEDYACLLLIAGNYDDLNPEAA